jgi:hypothetical protein
MPLILNRLRRTQTALGCRLPPWWGGGWHHTSRTPCIPLVDEGSQLPWTPPSLEGTRDKGFTPPLGERPPHYLALVRLGVCGLCRQLTLVRKHCRHRCRRPVLQHGLKLQGLLMHQGRHSIFHVSHDTTHDISHERQIFLRKQGRGIFPRHAMTSGSYAAECRP